MIKDLINVFKEIQKEYDKYSNSTKGLKFEEKFLNKLKNNNFSQLKKDDFEQNNDKGLLDKLKKEILNKDSEEKEILNDFKNIENKFIHQPYGTQQFPDFLVILKKQIIPIEIKYSTNSEKKKNLKSFKPMWNSNLPKKNAIYIYGVKDKGCTFFMGKDVLNSKTRKLLLEYFDNLKPNQEKIWKEKSKKIEQNNFGFSPYIRITYDQKVKYSTNKNKKIESYFSENKEEREDEVIKFLNNLSEK